MDDVDPGFQDARAKSERRSKIPIPEHRQRLSLQSGDLCTVKQRRSRRSKYYRAMHPEAKSFGEQQHLALTTTPLAAGVDVKNSEPCHPSSSRAANARKIPRSQGSGESFISSGCHWTASAHQSSPSLSTASIIPSGARAVTRSPGAGSRML
jgi:hypothetical protein